MGELKTPGQGREKSPKQMQSCILAVVHCTKKRLCISQWHIYRRSLTSCTRSPLSGSPIGQAGASLHYSGFTQSFGEHVAHKISPCCTGLSSEGSKLQALRLSNQVCKHRSDLGYSSALPLMCLWPSSGWHCLCLFPQKKCNLPLAQQAFTYRSQTCFSWTLLLLRKLNHFNSYHVGLCWYFIYAKKNPPQCIQCQINGKKKHNEITAGNTSFVTKLYPSAYAVSTKYTRLWAWSDAYPGQSFLFWFLAKSKPT